VAVHAMLSREESANVEMPADLVMNKRT